MGEKLEIIITADDKASDKLSNVGKSASGISTVFAQLIPGASKTTGAIEGLAEKMTKLAPSMGLSTEAAAGMSSSLIAMAGPIAAIVAVAGLAIVAFNGMAKAIDFAMAEAEAAEVAQAQLGAVIQSTGGAANISAEQINSLAAKLSEMSGIEENVIIQSSNVLLRFTSISEDIFPKAQQAALDLSVAMGTDLANASMTLGVALEKPSEGATRLRRSGVVLSEQLIATMKNMEDNGRIAQAQGLLLEQVAKRVGDSAVTMGGTVIGEQNKISNLFKNMAESFGGLLVPIKGDFLVVIRQILTTVSHNLEPAFAVARQQIKLLQQAFRDPETKKAIDELIKATAQLFSEAAIGAINIMSNAVRNMAANWKTNGPGIIKEITSIVDKLVYLAETFNKLTRIVGAFDDRARARSLPGYASGVMNAPGGLALVGERGPELVQLPRGSNVYPTGSAPAAASGGIKIYGPTYITAPHDGSLSALMQNLEAAATATA